MNICILTTATRDYIYFIPQLYQSIERYFLNGHTIHYLLFTDHDTVDAPVNNLRIHKIKHEPWPMMTLKRYRFHLREREFIQKHDYVFYLDADLLICNPVGDEILSDLVGAYHPTDNFYFKAPVLFSLERSPYSLACVPQFDPPFWYYYGAIQGGATMCYLKMAEVLAKAIDDDLARGVIARFHDESHLNKYFYGCPPSLTLPIGFIHATFQERILFSHAAKIMQLLAKFLLWAKRHRLPLIRSAAKLFKGISTIFILFSSYHYRAQSKIIALDKDHAAFRAEAPRNEAL